MNSAQIVSRLFSKLIANTPCPSTKINFLMVEGYNDHFYFRSLFVKFFPLFCPCFHCFALFHLFFILSPISLVIFFHTLGLIMIILDLYSRWLLLSYSVKYLIFFTSQL